MKDHNTFVKANMARLSAGCHSSDISIKYQVTSANL
jgi:hypothetical protein